MLRLPVPNCQSNNQTQSGGKYKIRHMSLPRVPGARGDAEKIHSDGANRPSDGPAYINIHNAILSVFGVNKRLPDYCLVICIKFTFIFVHNTSPIQHSVLTTF